MIDRVEHEEVRVHPKEKGAVINDLFIPGEKGCSPRREDHKNRTDKSRHSDSHDNSPDCACIRAVLLLRPDILADKCCRCLTE